MTPTTGHHQAEAGSGTRASGLAQRWANRRASSPASPLPDVVAPEMSAGSAFVQEWEMDQAIRRARAVRGAIAGLGIGVGLRIWHNGRRANPR